MKLSLLAASAFLIVFAAFVAWAPKPHEPKFQSVEQLNRHIFERYLASAARWPVVYVGSSLTERLTPEVDGSCAYNLAIAGGSSLTGLQLLIDAPVTPKIVLVEVNFPERRANAKLIAQSEGWLVRHWPLFATENKPVNLLLGYLTQGRGKAPSHVDPRLLALGLDLQRASYARTIPPDTLAERLRDFEVAVRALQKRGTQIVLFEMPVHPSLEDAPLARQTRAAFSEKFPDLSFVSTGELGRSAPIGTMDGVHLTDEEVPPVAKSLSSHHADACPNAQGHASGQQTAPSPL